MNKKTPLQNAISIWEHNIEIAPNTIKGTLRM